MNEQIKFAMEQNFTGVADEANAARERRRAGNDNLAEQVRLAFEIEKMKISPREAEASRRLDTNKLAEQLLQLRAMRNQPQSDE